MSKQTSDLYNFAKRAKERLRQNNYDDQPSVHFIDNSKCFASYINSQKRTPKTNFVASQKPKSSYDDELYRRVCNILESGNTQNPISLLIDKNLFNSLDTEAKQYYISNLTHKYKIMKSRYFAEHSFSLFV